MKGKIFNSAPLPFQGQKRRHLKEFKKALSGIETPLIVDLFGGSGLLSHVAKRTKPDSRVIYNDYDGYRFRLRNAEKTNRLIAEIRTMLEDYPKDKKVDADLKRKIVDRLEKEEKSGFVDWITVSSSLLFSMKYALSLEEMKKQTFYNCVRQSDYDTTGYLDGLEVVSEDYRTVFEKYKKHTGRIISDRSALFVDRYVYLQQGVVLEVEGLS